MQKLDPKAVWIFFFRFLFRGLFLFIFLGFWLGGIIASLAKKPGFPLRLGHLWWVLLPFVFYIIFCWIWAKLTYRFWGYQLAGNAFKKEHGVIWKKYVSIPYERIQNVDIRRGVIARILGLSDLHIQTAGSSAVVYGKRMAGVGAEGYLPGLERNKTEELREELVKRAKGAEQGL